MHDLKVWLVCNKVITPATHTQAIPALLPSRKASPPFGRYQLIQLGEQRHVGVRNLPRVSTLRARPRLEPTTSWSQVQQTNTIPTAPRRHLLHVDRYSVNVSVCVCQWYDAVDRYGVNVSVCVCQWCDTAVVVKASQPINRLCLRCQLWCDVINDGT